MAKPARPVSVAMDNRGTSVSFSASSPTPKQVTTPRRPYHGQRQAQLTTEIPNEKQEKDTFSRPPHHVRDKTR